MRLGEIKPRQIKTGRCDDLRAHRIVASVANDRDRLVKVPGGNHAICTTVTITDGMAGTGGAAANAAMNTLMSFVDHISSM